MLCCVAPRVGVGTLNPRSVAWPRVLGQGHLRHASLCGPLSWGYELAIHALFVALELRYRL